MYMSRRAIIRPICPVGGAAFMNQSVEASSPHVGGSRNTVPWLARTCHHGTIQKRGRSPVCPANAARGLRGRGEVFEDNPPENWTDG